MQTAYAGSATAKTMFDDWIATASNTITIDFKTGAFQAFLSTGKLEIDLAYLTDASYINNNGTAVEDTAVTAIVHELVHALTGRSDDGDNVTDYMGATVTFSNTIYEELGLSEQNSYIAYDSTGNILTRDFEYTNGTAIDRSESGDRNWNSSAAGNSKDLLIGGSSANTLQGGDGDDFLFGAGGDDNLNGGNGTDTGVLTGKPTDYDVRLNADGTWTSRHVRGASNEGTDTFSNLEKVQFEGGETFDLEKNGLTFQTDFAFVVDQTGSMWDDIDAVKASANAIVEALFAGDTIDARVGVVSFRDNTIGEPTQVILPFTDQDVFTDRKAAALAAINSLGASGGGDFPETAFDGLLKALDGSTGEWRVGAGTKQVVLFTDATAKDSFLLPTVEAFALDIGAVITSGSTAALGTFGAVDTFELSTDGAPARDPASEGDVLPPFVPSDDPVIAPGGTGTVQIFTIFVESFTTPDPSLVEISEATGGDVLTAATPEEVVERLFEVISGNAPPDAVDDAFSIGEDQTLIGNVLDDNGNGTDSDADGDALTVSLVSGPSEGILTLNDDGSFSYEADADLFDISTPGDVMEQSFTYQIDDGNGGVDQATATIAVTILGDGETIIGTNKPDILTGTDGGEDLIKGGNAKDILSGLDGADELHGENGPDELYGGESIDQLFGGRGNDLLDGGEGNDILDGGRGDDILIGGLSDDRVTGGRGSDIFVIGPLDGADTFTDFKVGSDLIGLADGLTFGDLSFSGNDISLGSETLATLVGVDTTGLSEDVDFVLL